MVTLFGMLELNRRSLLSSQYALQTINHNIANVNTAGYSRQQVNMHTSYPIKTSFGVLGTGVSAVSVQRATAEFYTRQMRNENSTLGGWDATCSVLSEIEMIVNEPSDTGLASALDAFFSAWNDLASDPESSALRVGVVESAKTLCETMHEMDHSLQKTGDNIESQIKYNVDQFNKLLTMISELNGKIVATESSGVSASDLRDERDRLILEASRIARIDVKEDRYGAVDVFLGGTNVVHRSEARYLDTSLESLSGNNWVEVVAENNGETIRVEDGELAGLLEVRAENLDQVRNSLDNIASILIAKVNEIHSRGMTSQGSGFDFFVGEGAGDISISLPIEQNADLVATSYDGTIGDNTLANDICTLSETIISEDEPLTINGLYESLVAEVGIYSRNARNMMSNQTLILDNIELRKESITGVNLDEELIQLTKFEQSYEAAARVLKTVEELTDTILDLVQGIY